MLKGVNILCPGNRRLSQVQQVEKEVVQFAAKAALKIYWLFNPDCSGW